MLCSSSTWALGPGCLGLNLATYQLCDSGSSPNLSVPPFPGCRRLKRIVLHFTWLLACKEIGTPLAHSQLP